MTRSIIGRTAACGGALVLAIGAGCIVAPAADAAPSGLGPTLVGTVTDLTGSSSSPVSTVTSTVTDLTGSSSSPVPTATSTLTGGSSSSSGSPDPVPAVTGTVADVTGGTGGGTGATASDPVPTVTGTVTDLIGAGSSGGSSSGSDSGTGGISVTVGRTGDGGSLAAIGLGGQRSGGAGASGSTGSDGSDGSDGARGVDGAPAVAASTPSPAVPSAAPSSTAPAGADLLGLQLRSSVATVYPVKDGYRDGVAFTLAGLTADGRPRAIQGVAVLSRGTKAVKRWNLQRSDQVLRWNGRTGTRIVAGAYRLVVAARDADGHAFSAATGVAVSPKRLVASTRALEALAVTGTHRMDPAPRAGLTRGRVTVQVTTIASKVRGAQQLVFQHGRKRIVVPVRQGTHTSRAITVPKEFTSFRIRHTWKKGQVALQSVRYTYSYQALK